MSKYIDVEKLRKKIAEQMESVPRDTGRGNGTVTLTGYGMIQAFLIVRSIIDSLQQEQPEEELELESEIERIVKNEEKFMKFQARCQLIGYVARHFAKWGAIHFNAIKE